MIHNYDSGDTPEGQTWSGTRLQQDFEVIAFAAPYVEVVRKSDGVRGRLQFTHSPRVYFGFEVNA